MRESKDMLEVLEKGQLPADALHDDDWAAISVCAQKRFSLLSMFRLFGLDFRSPCGQGTQKCGWEQCIAKVEANQAVYRASWRERKDAGRVLWPNDRQQFTFDLLMQRAGNSRNEFMQLVRSELERRMEVRAVFL